MMLSTRLPVAVLGLLLITAHCAWAAEIASVEPRLSQSSRLMVFAPHPDDETIGAGGLIQRALSTGGRVKVVFMTNGDGYPKGVEIEDHTTHPTAKQYREYGEKRQAEALKALATLGVKARDAVFLGFPDGGLCDLLWRFRSDPQAYTSPFTLENHPPAPDMILPHTDYNAHDLIAEIKRLLAQFDPTLVAVTPPEDEHPDHCSTYYFVRKAIADLGRKHPGFRPMLLTFLIHFKQWPFDQGAEIGARLRPPVDFPDKRARWVQLALKPEEAETKNHAILDYHSQMLVIGPYLSSFATANELFLIEHRSVSNEMATMPCCRK